jgi:hypothetical protein
MKHDEMYDEEDVLFHAKQSFSDVVALKLKHLRSYVPKNSNPALTGDFIEELVRTYIQAALGHRLLLNGTFYSSEFEESGQKPLQVDGIIYDPTQGPAIIREGNFVVVHPVFCTGVIEIKTSYSENLENLQKRLEILYHLYMHHLKRSQVMAVIIADPNPQAKSQMKIRDRQFPAYAAFDDWSPIFVLFQEKDGEYSPYEHAIDALIRNIYINLSRSLMRIPFTL